MTGERRTALVAGLLYLVTFASSIPAALLLQPILGNPNYVTSSGADGQVAFACLLDLVNAAACVGTAVALFPVVKRQHEGFALGFVASRTLEAAIIVIGVVCLMAVVTLRQQGPSGGDPSGLVASGRALVAVRDWTFLLGPSLMPAPNAFFLGWLLYRSRLVPRLIPAVGLVGAPLLLLSTMGTLLGVNQLTSVWTVVATLPIFAWELSVGLWMTFRGFSPSAPILARPA